MNYTEIEGKGEKQMIQWNTCVLNVISTIRSLGNKLGVTFESDKTGMRWLTSPRFRQAFLGGEFPVENQAAQETMGGIISHIDDWGQDGCAVLVRGDEILAKLSLVDVCFNSSCKCKYGKDGRLSEELLRKGHDARIAASRAIVQ